MALFPNLSDTENHLLEATLSTCSFRDKAVIFKQGQKADMFYILIEGMVVIQYKPYDAPEITVSHITPGDVFGWSAAMGRGNYSSAAIAVADCKTYCVSHRRMMQMYQRDPETGIILLRALANGIAKRLNSTYEQILTILVQGVSEQAL